ncbi:hypothetical protein ACOMHN_032032 [Nucella lapillus]
MHSTTTQLPDPRFLFQLQILAPVPECACVAQGLANIPPAPLTAPLNSSPLFLLPQTPRLTVAGSGRITHAVCKACVSPCNLWSWTLDGVTTAGHTRLSADWTPIFRCFVKMTLLVLFYLPGQTVSSRAGFTAQRMSRVALETRQRPSGID